MPELRRVLRDLLAPVPKVAVQKTQPCRPLRRTTYTFQSKTPLDEKAASRYARVRMCLEAASSLIARHRYFVHVPVIISALRAPALSRRLSWYRAQSPSQLHFYSGE